MKDQPSIHLHHRRRRARDVAPMGPFFTWTRRRRLTEFAFTILAIVTPARGGDPFGTPSLEMLDLYEREAQWRLGTWWERPWCRIDSEAEFLDSLPDQSALVLRNGTMLLSPEVLRHPRWRSRSGYLRDQLQATYRPWEFYDAEVSDSNPSLDALALSVLEVTKPAPTSVPILAHCREADAASASSAAATATATAAGGPSGSDDVFGGLVLWPGLRHSTDKVREAMRDAQVLDMPWSRKRLQAVWRGKPTNLHETEACHTVTDSGTAAAAAAAAGPDTLDLCGGSGASVVDRERFVSTFLNDDLFDVGFSSATSSGGGGNGGGNANSAVGPPPELVRGRLTLGATLRFAVVIELGGRSCGTSLTWAFGTNSVVALAHPPTHESPVLFGMEPWSHYIPFRHDLSDLRENVAWCMKHSEECAAIAAAARRHVSRVFLPAHERVVQGTMLRRLAENARSC
ncbi:unnamed protein product [Phaeothamnion confervicola]